MTLINDLTTNLGTDISAFLDSDNVTTIGGDVTQWQEARGGAGPTLTPNGTVPFTVGVGLSFDSTAFLKVTTALISNLDNWAMLCVINPSIVGGSNPIVMSNGDGSNGVGMKVSPAGCLFEGISEVTMSSGALAATMQLLTLQRVSGTTNLRINGTATGVGASGTAPASFSGAAGVLGGTGTDHDKFNGIMRAAIFVPTHPGSSGMTAAESALLSAYGIAGVVSAPTQFRSFSMRRR